VGLLACGAGAVDRWRVVRVKLGELPPLVGSDLPIFRGDSSM
jgi:hypothetical protein